MAAPWEKYGAAPNGPAAPVTIGAPDPAVPLDLRLKGLRVDEAAAEAPFTGSMAAAAARKAEADARKAEIEAARGPQRSATEIEIENKKLGEARRAAVIRSIMGDARDLYENTIKGQPANRLFGATEFIGGLPDNQEFNTAAMGMLPLIRPLVAQTAKEGDSDKEMEVFMAYIPRSGDTDQAIERKFSMLETLIGGMVDGRLPSETQSEQSGRGGLGARPAPGQNPPPSGGGTVDRTALPNAPGGDGTGIALSQRGQSYVTDTDRRLNTLANAVLARGGTAEEANALASEMGFSGPSGRPVFDPAQWNRALAYNRANPNAERPATVGVQATGRADPSAWNRFAASPVGSAVGGYLGGLTAGGFDELYGGVESLMTGRDLSEAIADIDLKRGLSAQANPGWALGGNIAGGVTSFLGAQNLLGRVAPGLAAGLGRFAAPAGDLAYGVTAGALESNDNRLLGAGLGAGAGLAGGAAGRGIGNGLGMFANSRAGRAIGDGYRNVRGLPAANRPNALSPAETMAFSGVSRAGPDDIIRQLEEAQGFGIPMTLADTHPELRTLAGSAVRRSPSASETAENVLVPRSRGQIDRFSRSIENELGPVQNIPQLSDDLIRQARERAGPLYDQAYAAPAVGTAEIDTILNTPFGRSAIGRARTIAANERRDPAELGLILDEAGQPMLNPVPNDLVARHLSARADLSAAQDNLRSVRQGGAGSIEDARSRVLAAREAVRAAERALEAAPTPGGNASTSVYTPQTLDYVKRGMDDVLEQYRNPLTGQLHLDEAGRAQNQVRSQFVSEVDRTNPAYAAARAAYAGPAAEREALRRGQDAYRANPDELPMIMARQSPSHADQMRLGFNDAMMQNANRMRLSSNPFDATAGTPAAEQRLRTMYPEGADNFLRIRDIERQLQNTSNDILGNSKTAQRLRADRDFEGDDMLNTVVDAGVNIATGQVPTGLLLKQGTAQGIKDAWKMGVGNRARQKAEDLAPILLNPNPTLNIEEIARLGSQAADFQNYRNALQQRFRRPLGMFGAAGGAQLAVN